MKKYLVQILALISVILIFVTTGCKKDQILNSGGEVGFSTDTLTFDTVFTDQGSFTTSVKIYNPQGQRIQLSNVRMENGENSYFNINVNGVNGNSVNNVDIAANDSIYVFATVNIDPTNANTPFLVQDNLVVTLNGKTFKLPFEAYGQNAYYIIDSVMETQTWKTDKPYVIIHNALVDKGETLTIPAGCRIYVNGDSRLYVEGTLKINGTKEDTVVFQGNRLDRKYFGNEGYPGEWGGIYFTSNSRLNEINYTVLKNCGNTTRLGEGNVLAAAIQVNIDSVNDGQPQLRISNSRIENSFGYGIVSFSGSVIATNCLINTCGAQAFAAFQGGAYRLDHCSFVVYGTNKVSHIDNPTVALLNYFDIDNTSYISGDLVAQLTNCVIWGSLENEVFVNSRGDKALCTVDFENCLVKSKEPNIYDSVNLINTIVNQDPQFVDINSWDFRPSQGSPLIDNGVDIGVNIDLNGDSRPVGPKPDIGCYEYR